MVESPLFVRAEAGAGEKNRSWYKTDRLRNTACTLCAIKVCLFNFIFKYVK